MSNGENLQTRAAMIATSKATIVRAPGWQPIRTFVQYAQRKPVGTFVSRKSNRVFPWEGYGERHLMWISEADTTVERFLAQPHRLEIRVEGNEKPLYYFPDLLRRLEDGTTEIIEVKQRDDEIEKDPDYAFKLKKAKRIYAALEWKFRIVVAEDELEIDPILSNADMICADNFSLIRTRERLAMEEAFQVDGAIPYGKAVETIADASGISQTRATAVLHAMVCTRTAAIDVNKRITRDSAVIKPNKTRGRR
ncbi:hypothetical protein Nham_1363 [Nitrobacter hamburgensis X14]|uniref:TnsA endonuclease N-terminal domain-containing protein n=1 Tax=Nitrobacter hamburgensis (strain DSM 10229 / NCIMB 13809 / X14) TaxID=323097 RepID=Q1QNL0_NITHX|nr:TnsA endonuclease N-terminal domain-containing protein [Nitrobacter hamburgensis]ABE62187.1 hypothetical protein Nham_1363 [Nitrobacter hamburgensis X14]